MWETFKILLLCLISIFIATLTASWFYFFVLFIVFIIIFYDFDFSTAVERHAISKLKYSYLKVRNLYAAIFESEESITSCEYTPTMNSINKQTSSFELSRFNKSGNVLSPISSGSSNGAFSSRRLIQSRQTSTPLTRTSPWQKNSLSPTNPTRNSVFHSTISSRNPRYSLSSFSPKSGNNETPPKPTIQTVTGPLLASTRFNVNLGTYTDSKSPGLASRVVQYHNELSGNQTSTHQSKYGCPGQFPIVQLYKRELPILGRTSRRCTVRIAPPDPVPFTTEHANTVLRDSFVPNNVENGNRQSDTEINTKSVLEALKEISRKRIHTNDDLDDISKRQRTNSVSSSSSNSIHVNKDGKRMREDTPPKPKETCTTPVNSAPKRICVVNEIESSLSSSRLMRLQQGQKRKSSVNTPETNKQRRMSNGELISRETQTTVTNSTKTSSQDTKISSQKTTSTAAQTEHEPGSGLLDVQQLFNDSRQRKKPHEFRTTRDIDEENSTLQFAKTTDFPTKSIFSEAPLEIMKENKLSVMLSALAGQEPEIIPLPDMTLSALKKKTEDNVDGSDVISKEVISILSPKNKAKHDKHVTFAIPNSEAANSTTIAIISTPDEIQTINSTSASVPIPASSNANNLTNTITSCVPIMSVNFSSTIAFGTPSQTAASSSVTFSAVPTAQVSSALGNSLFGTISPLNSKANSVTTTTDSVNVVTSSSIEKSDSANKNTINFGAPNFNFGASTAKPPAFGSLVSSANKEDVKKSSLPAVTNAGFQFSSTIATPATTAGSITFGSPISFGAKSSIPSAFTSANSDSTPSTTKISICPTTNQQLPSLLPTNSSATAGGLFSFGPKSEPKTTSNFSFGSSTPSTIQSPPKPGGFKFDLGKSAAAASAPSKSEPSKTSMFSATKPGTFAFGASAPATSTTIGFTSTTNPTPGFGAQNPTTSAPTFGAPNKTVSSTMFGAPTTTASSATFGAPVTTLSGSTFGVPVTTLSSASFGASGTTLSSGTFASTTTNADMFGSSPSAFSAPKTAESPPSFGAFGAPSTAQSSGFGTAIPNSSTFGFGAPTTTQSNAFGAPTTTQSSAFGSTPATTTSSFTFGPTTSTKTFAFGSTTTATTTAATMFGSTTTSTPSNLFGGNKTSGFGTPTTTAQSSFGQPSTPQTANVFGNPSSSFAPGSSGSVFGSNNTNNNAFGASTPPNVFGSAVQQPQPSTFGTAAPAQGAGFGMNNHVFGGTNSNNNNNTFGPNANTSFGNGFNNNAQSSGIGNFAPPAAQAASPSAGVFTFGGAAQAAATPGTSNAFQFGAGSQTPKQSGFNFSTTNTPNINFGSGAPSTFSATPAPAFGSPVPGQFNAPAPSTGMFNIGSGSTAPKQRPMIKARRRN